MPALPSKQSRRKTITPIVKRDPEHVFDQVLEALGLEAVSSNHNENGNTKTNTTMAAIIETPSPAPSSSRNLSILDLPSETQKDILKYVQSSFQAQAVPPY